MIVREVIKMRAGKRKMISRILAALVITIQITVLMSFAVFASEGSGTAEYGVYISDEEDLLTDEEEEQLYEVMLPLTAYGNVGFASTHSDNAEKTVRDTSYEWFHNESSTLFLIDMGDRMIKLANTGAIYDRINDNYMNLVTDNAYTYAGKGEYLACAQKVFEQELILLEGGRIAQPMKLITNILVAIVLGLLINFIFVWIKKGKTRITDKELIAAVAGAAVTAKVSRALVSSKRTRHSSSSSGGGGFSGGGGGGGFSGGTGGHSF